MKHKILATSITLLLLMSVLSIATPIVPVSASPTADYETAIAKAADRLVALQSGMDFGWDWVVTGQTTHSATPSATNLYGVTALGLLDACQLTGNTSYFNAAEDLAEFITYGNASEGDFYNGLYHDFGHGASWYWWGYSFDYRYLVRFSEISGNTTYKDYAVDAWNWVKENRGEYYGDGNQTAMYNHMYGHYAAHGGAIWQSGDFALAALACGDTAWAENMSAVIQSNLTKIDATDGDRFIGWGKALETFQEVDPATYSTEISTMVGNLSDSQGPAGNFSSAVQDNAYSIIGLIAVNETSMAENAADWLVANQGYDTIKGGWKEPTGKEYSEITSEAAQALYAVIQGIGPVALDHGSDGTIDVKTMTIQKAIDAAYPGDTIIVYPGTYTEYLHITTDNLTIEGAGIDQSIIDLDGLTPYWHYSSCSRSYASRAGVLISGYGSPDEVVENITFRGFTVKNAGLNPPITATGTHTGSDNASVLTDSSASWTPGALVGLWVHNLDDRDIDYSPSRSYGQITANTATTVTATLTGGVENDWDTGDAYAITYEHFYDQFGDGQDDVRGISIANGKNILIQNCKVLNSGYGGITVGKARCVSTHKYSEGVTIDNCVSSDHPVSGISVGTYIGPVTITNNIASNNKRPHLADPTREYQGFGIQVSGKSATSTLSGVISNNTCTDNGFEGIIVTKYTDGVTVENNMVTGHNFDQDGAGIFLYHWGHPEHCKNHIIRNNTVTGNIRGIIAYYASNCTIENNTITTDCGIFPKGQGAIKIDGSNNIEVKNNVIGTSDLDGTGISVVYWEGYGTISSYGNTFTGNTITGAQFAGIFISGDAHDNTFTNNTITSTTSLTRWEGTAWEETQADGVFIDDDAGTGNVFHYNNIYDHDDDGMENQISTTVDARFNWWGDASGPEHPSNPGGVGDSVSDNVDYSPWLGFLVGTRPMTWHVNPTGAPGAIQEAIDEASPGDTILVHSGGYDGFDANVSGITVKPASAPVINGTGISVAGQIVGVLVSAHDVAIEGFVIHGLYSTGIWVYNPTTPPHGTQIKDNIVNMTGYDPGALATWDASAVMAHAGSGTPTVISGNIVEYASVGDTEARSQNGINVFGDNDADYTISGNTITDRTPIENCLGDPPWKIRRYHQAVNVRTGEGSATIEDNIITSDVGPMWKMFGIRLYGAGIDKAKNVVVENNTITKMAYAFWVSGPNTDNILAEYNDFSDNDFGVVVEWSAPGVKVNHNDIYGNTVGAYSDGNQVVDARFNWWGHASGPNQTATNPSGLGDKVTDKVTYSPWLGFVVGTTPMTYHVNPTGKIQDAIDDASPSDTILVHDGTYIENVNVNKPVTLKAAFHPVIDGNQAGPCITIAADGVTIDGFELTNGTAGVASWGTDNSVISNNIIHDNLNVPGFMGIGIIFWSDSDDFDNNTIVGNEIYNNDRQGIYIGGETEGYISEGNTISGNTIYYNGLNKTGMGPDASMYGIQLSFADDNTIVGNEIYGHDDWFPYPDFDFAQGIYLFDSNNNNITCNNLHDNNYGVGLYHYYRTVGTNYINYNNIAGNTGYGVRTFDDPPNVDARYNWWGNATGPTHSGNPGGTGDRVSDNVDYDPWLDGPIPGDVAIISIAPSRNMACEGQILDIYVTVKNEGDPTSTFNVTLYYNNITIGTQAVTDLAPSANTTLTFSWDTTGVTPCINYTLRAEAHTIPCEAKTANNILTDGKVKINIMGDINGDGKVDITDVYLVIMAFGLEASFPNWNPAVDLNSDNRIDITDIYLTILNFGKTHP